MENSTNYDAIIIGSGQSGSPLATALAGAGWKTAIIEEKHVAGTCINEGCTPTKTMIASARVAYLARRSEDYGVQSGLVKINLAKVRQRKRDIVESFRQGSERRIVNSGADLIMGRAAFSGFKEIEVQLNEGGTGKLTADRFFLNVGARPRIPELAGLNQVPYLNSTTIMELEAVPDHLIIIGGGYIGVEFSQMFRRFGSQVTIIQHGGQLLAREDQDISEEVLQILREDGVEVVLDSQAHSVAVDEKGELELVVETPEGKRAVAGSHLLIAVGRIPNSDGLNLTETGVKTDPHNYIQVNDRLETNVSGIYAMGDVKGGPAFTHISYDDFRILRTNLLENGNGTIKDRLVPYTVFMDPQLGRVGLTERQAREQGINFQVAKMPMNYVSRALEIDESRGFMKVLVSPETEQILGVAILGVEGGEIAAILQVAMMGKLPYTALRDGIFTHPTLAESVNNLFGNL
jgi:pyruvate/2-oxoglutarate dehydrogenase complex dihydrolipoamide dehydrogenase (E3) component